MILIFRNESEKKIMIKRIKNEENVKGFIVQNDVEKMLIHYSEQVNGEKNFQKPFM